MYLLRRQGVIEPSRQIAGSSGYIYTVRGWKFNLKLHTNARRVMSFMDG
jgi:hypothetical protein